MSSHQGRVKDIENFRKAESKKVQQDRICTVRVFKRSEIKFSDKPLGLLLKTQPHRAEEEASRDGFQAEQITLQYLGQLSDGETRWKTFRVWPTLERVQGDTQYSSEFDTESLTILSLHL